MKIKKIIYIILGFICLGLGIVGIILPVLPTVPFLLCTSFFFSRGSTKFDNWFKSTKIYHKYLENFVKNKVMTLKGKVILLSLVSGMLFFAMWKVNSLAMSICITILIIIKYLYFILYVETVTKEEYIARRKVIHAEEEK